MFWNLLFFLHVSIRICFYFLVLPHFSQIWMLKYRFSCTIPVLFQIKTNPMLHLSRWNSSIWFSRIYKNCLKICVFQVTKWAEKVRREPEWGKCGRILKKLCMILLEKWQEKLEKRENAKETSRSRSSHWQNKVFFPQLFCLQAFFSLHAWKNLTFSKSLCFKTVCLGKEMAEIVENIALESENCGYNPKRDANWDILPMEMRAECIKRMDFITRFDKKHCLITAPRGSGAYNAEIYFSLY